MKKMMTMLLALAMVFSLAACGGTANGSTTPTAASKPALEGTLEEILNKVIEKEPVEFMGMAMPVDLADADAVKYMTGLDSTDGIAEAAVFEPMMGSIAFSMIMVRTAEGTDPKVVAENMKNGVDTRKWICVEADDLMIATYGNVAMLIMVSTTNGMQAQSFVDAFQSVCGADLDSVG